MPKYGLLVVAILSVSGLVISPNGVRARTIHECNTIYNNCSANCDKYASSAGSAASCISNCGTKAQTCHDTASDRPNKAMTVAPPKGGNPKVPKSSITTTTGIMKDTSSTGLKNKVQTNTQIQTRTLNQTPTSSPSLQKR
jgi:hypothetical protein